MKGIDLMLRSLATPIVFALIALGFHFFLRGHNAPGGGFIAGLVVAVAALLTRMARNVQLLRFRPERLIPWGLLVAFLTGVIPMAFGYGFLKSAYGYLDWPLIGEFEWATAVAFDLGVFLVVVGTTVTIIDLLADEGHLTYLGEAAGEPAGSGEDAGNGVEGESDGDDDAPAAGGAAGERR